MASSVRFALLGALTLLVATGASAAELPFEATYGITFSNYTASPTATGTGIATVNGSGGLGHLQTLRIADNIAAIDATIPTTTTLGAALSLRLSGVGINPEGSFPFGSGTPGPQGGIFAPISGAAGSAATLSLKTLPIRGRIRVCLFFPGCTQAATALASGTNGFGDFVGAGVGGILTMGTFRSQRISTLGAPWTLKTVSVSNRTSNGGTTTPTAMGFAHGPATLTSSTALTSGVVQLVTPVRIVRVGVDPFPDRVGQLHRLTLHFVPEPAVALALAFGASAVALLGRRRSRGEETRASSADSRPTPR